MNELFGGQSGQGESLRRIVSHFSIPGETFLVGFDDPEHDGEGRRWIVVSREEVSQSRLDGTVEVMLPESMQKVALDLGPGGTSAMIRLWRPHPRVAIDPDSAMIPLRSVLREILNLSAHVMASSESRLAGAGILAVPDEITSPDERQSEGDVNPIHPDPFCASLIQAMITPLKDRNSASAVAPMVVRGPADAIDKIKHLTFNTPFDERVLGLREAALRRMATGLDLPSEVVLGLGDANHWTAWALEEATLKVSISPLMGMIAEALTTHFLRPALKALEVEDPGRYAVGFDMTALTQRPNRAPEAQQAHDRVLLSNEALLREMGFDPEDYPSDEERRERLIEKLVLSNGQLAPYLLPMLGVDVPGLNKGGDADGQAPEERERAELERTDRADSDGTGTPAAEGDRNEPPDRSQSDARALAQAEGGPEPVAASAVSYDTEPAQVSDDTSAGGETRRDPGETPRDDSRDIDVMAEAVMVASAQAAEWRTTALEIGVLRALERAGQWLLNAHSRSWRGQLREVPMHSIHTQLPPQENWLDRMLEGGYRELTASLSDRPCMVRAVDQYVRALLMAQLPHEREYLAAALEQAGCDADAA